MGYVTRPTPASSAEVTAGSNANKYVTPDTLAASTIFGYKSIVINVVDSGTDLAVVDGAAYITVPAALNGMNLIRVHARVITAGTTNVTTIQIYNLTQTADMLSTRITIDSTETGSDTADVPAVIDATNDDVATNDVLRIDIDTISTTAPKGLIITMEFQLL